MTFLMNLPEQVKGLILVLGAGALYTTYRFWIHRPKGSKEYQTGHAKVLSRRLDQNRGSASGTSIANRGVTGSSRWKYLVTFEVGPQILELQVEEGHYRRLKEGTTGMLEWQYEYLVSFEPDAED